MWRKNGKSTKILKEVEDTKLVGLNNIVEKAVVEEAAVDEQEPMDVEEEGPLINGLLENLKQKAKWLNYLIRGRI